MSATGHTLTNQTEPGLYLTSTRVPYYDQVVYGQGYITSSGYTGNFKVYSTYFDQYNFFTGESMHVDGVSSVLSNYGLPDNGDSGGSIYAVGTASGFALVGILSAKVGGVWYYTPIQTIQNAGFSPKLN